MSIAISIAATSAALTAGLAIPALADAGLLSRWAGALVVLVVAALMAAALASAEPRRPIMWVSVITWAISPALWGIVLWIILAAGCATSDLVLVYPDPSDGIECSIAADSIAEQVGSPHRTCRPE